MRGIVTREYSRDFNAICRILLCPGGLFQNCVQILYLFAVGGENDEEGQDNDYVLYVDGETGSGQRSRQHSAVRFSSTEVHQTDADS
jgi:hypothetical protein